MGMGVTLSMANPTLILDHNGRLSKRAHARILEGVNMGWLIGVVVGVGLMIIGYVILKSSSDDEYLPYIGIVFMLLGFRT